MACLFSCETSLNPFTNGSIATGLRPIPGTQVRRAIEPLLGGLSRGEWERQRYTALSSGAGQVPCAGERGGGVLSEGDQSLTKLQDQKRLLKRSLFEKILRSLTFFEWGRCLHK